MTDTPREALSLIADGPLHELETPALLRRVAGMSARAGAAGHAILEASTLHPELVPNDFVLVDFEVRPGVRNYRLVRLPKNDRWRIRIGALQRRVHRAFVILARCIARSLAAPGAGVPVARLPGERLPERCVRIYCRTQQEAPCPTSGSAATRS